MFKWFWGRLRQWVRRIWGRGKAKDDNATGQFDQEKALTTGGDIVPHGGTPGTTQANTLSDGHPPASVSPNEAHAADQRAPSAGEKETSEKMPIDDRQPPSESEQSNTQFGDHDDAGIPDGQLHPESKQKNAQIEDHCGQGIDDEQLLSKQKNVPSGDHRDEALDDGNDATAIRHLPEEPPTVDYTTHEREPVVEENVTKHVHTVYELERTRSTHVHEHFYHVQPVIDTSDPKEEDGARG